MDERPMAPRVLGILSMVFGAIVVTLSLIGLGVDPTKDFALDEKVRAAVVELTATIEPWSTIQAYVVIVLGLSLVFIGFGQRRYQRWAQRAAVTWSIVALAVLAAQLALQLGLTGPAFERYLRQALGDKAPESMTSITVTGAVAMLALYAPFPIVQLVFMRRPNVAAVMNA